MLFIGALQTWSSDPGSGSDRGRVSVFFQVSEESSCLLLPFNFQKVGLIVATMVVTASSVVSLQAKNGLPFHNQVAAWSILGM